MSNYEAWQIEKYGNIIKEYKNPLLILNEQEESDLTGWNPFDIGNQIIIEE